MTVKQHFKQLCLEYLLLVNNYALQDYFATFCIRRYTSSRLLKIVSNMLEHGMHVHTLPSYTSLHFCFNRNRSNFGTTFSLWLTFILSKGDTWQKNKARSCPGFGYLLFSQSELLEPCLSPALHQQSSLKTSVRSVGDINSEKFPYVWFLSVSFV